MKVITDQGVYGDEQGATRECTAEEAEDDTLCAMVEVVTDVDGDAINTILLEILQSEVNSAVVRLACPGQGHGETKQVLDGGINAVKDVSTIPNFPSAVSGPSIPRRFDSQMSRASRKNPSLGPLVIELLIPCTLMHCVCKPREKALPPSLYSLEVETVSPYIRPSFLSP